MTTDPRLVFFDLEHSLLSAGRVRGRANVQASGLIEASLSGSFSLQAGNVADFGFRGTFRGQAVEPRLVSDGRQMRGGSLDKTFDDPTSSALREAICYGFMRMGILHNLARLSAGAPPDHAQGGAADWVAVSRFSWGEPVHVSGRPAIAIRFDIVVDSSRNHEATLWLDQDSGLPLRRRQTTNFSDGPMIVEECYLEVDIT